METLERVAGVLADKYKSDESSDPSQAKPETADDGSARIEDAAPSEPQLAATSGDGSGPDAKHGSRWRLALRDRPVAAEAE